MYLFELSRLTASMWPKSMSCPRRNMNSSLQTYFFFWYPSRVLSPWQQFKQTQPNITLAAMTQGCSVPHTLAYSHNFFYHILIIKNVGSDYKWIKPHNQTITSQNQYSVQQVILNTSDKGGQRQMTASIVTHHLICMPAVATHFHL